MKTKGENALFQDTHHLQFTWLVLHSPWLYTQINDVIKEKRKQKKREDSNDTT